MEQLNKEWEINEMNAIDSQCTINNIDKYVFKIQNNNFQKYGSKNILKEEERINKKNKKTKIINLNQTKKAKKKGFINLILKRGNNDNVEELRNLVNPSQILRKGNDRKKNESKFFNINNTLYQKLIQKESNCSINNKQLNKEKEKEKETTEKASKQISLAKGILEQNNIKIISKNRREEIFKCFHNSEKCLNRKCARSAPNNKLHQSTQVLSNLQTFLKNKNVQKLTNVQNKNESLYSSKFHNINSIKDEINRNEEKIIIRNEFLKQSRNNMNFKHTKKMERLEIPVGDENEQNDFNFNSPSEKNGEMFASIENDYNNNYMTNFHIFQKPSPSLIQKICQNKDYSIKNKNLNDKIIKKSKKNNANIYYTLLKNSNLNPSQEFVRNNAYLKTCVCFSKKDELIKLNRLDRSVKQPTNDMYKSIYDLKNNKQLLTAKKITVSLANLKTKANFSDVIIPSDTSGFKFCPIFYTPNKFQSTLDANLTKALAKISQIRSISNRTSVHENESDDHSKTTISSYSMKSSFSSNQNDIAGIIKNHKQINI